MRYSQLLARIGTKLALAILLFTACGGVPEELQVEQLLLAQVAEGPNGQWVEVQNFEVRDSLMEDTGTFVCEVSYELVYTKSSQELLAEQQRSLEESPAEGANLEAALGGIRQMVMSMSTGNFEAGHRTFELHALRLKKWDSGWRLEK